MYTVVRPLPPFCMRARVCLYKRLIVLSTVKQNYAGVARGVGGATGGGVRATGRWFMRAYNNIPPPRLHPSFGGRARRKRRRRRLVIVTDPAVVTRRIVFFSGAASEVKRMSAKWLDAMTKDLSSRTHRLSKRERERERESERVGIEWRRCLGLKGLVGGGAINCRKRCVLLITTTNDDTDTV